MSRVLTRLKHDLGSRWKTRFRDSHLLGVLHKQIFGGNALPGHLVVLLIGASFGFLDYPLGLKGTVEQYGVGLGLVVIASLLLPYQGYDASEKIQADILTFSLAGTVGISMGGLISGFLLSSDGRMAEGTYLSVSGLCSIFVGVVALIAYYTVGYMSRQLRFEDFVFADPPLLLKRLIVFLRNLPDDPQSKAGDELVKTLLAHNLAAPLIATRLMAMYGFPFHLRERVLDDVSEWLNPPKDVVGDAKTTYRKPKLGVGGLRK